MPKVSAEVPSVLRPFTWLGMELRVGTNQAHGKCWACGREGKFYVSCDDGQWSCFGCSVKGNVITFLRQLHQLGIERAAIDSDLSMASRDELTADRGLIFPSTLLAWGVVRSPINDEWLVPAYSADGKLHQLYRYCRLYDAKDRTWSKRLLPTPGVWPDGQVHGIFAAREAVQHLVASPQKTHDVYVCEGPWDGMAWWEMLHHVKRGSTDGEYHATGNIEESLGAHCTVLATPGANVFQESWGPLMEAKRVQLMYDNDHPRIENSRSVDGAGLSGMRRVAEVLAVCPERQECIRYLRWGVKGYDPDRRSGYDVRDWLKWAGDTVTARIPAVRSIISSLFPIPQEWVAGRSPAAKATGRTDLEVLPCTAWVDLVPHWKRWSPDGWPESGVGLDHGLAFAMSVILSTEGVGDQLWGMVLGPPSSGKTTIAEALSPARRFVYPLSTLRGIYSGIKDDSGDGADFSLILKVRNKTLVIKDGDTLMQSPNLVQILSELRDVYDRFGRTDYRTVGTRNYEGINLTILLHGTGQLHSLDHSEVGQRFLKCVVAEGVDYDEERRIAMMKARSASRNLGKMSNCQAGSGEDKDYVTAKQYTAGYVEHLRHNAEDILTSVHIGGAVEEMCADLGIFVACMRAQPARQQTEVAEREYGYRLVSQLTRLSGCLAGALNSPREVKDEIMDRVRRIALDTGRGRTLKTTKRLYEEGRVGIGADPLATCVSEPKSDMHHLLRYLEKIRVVESFTPLTSVGIGKVRQQRWRLTDTVREMYQRVTGV